MLTLDLERDAVVKVEKIESSGRTKPVSDAEFATLAGVAGVEDIRDALEDAYAQGMTDGLEYAASGELEDDAGLEDLNASGPEAAGEIDASVRHLLLRRMLRRERTRSAHNGKHKHTHESDTETLFSRGRRSAH
jgi:hypothetical protein